MIFAMKISSGKVKIRSHSSQNGARRDRSSQVRDFQKLGGCCALGHMLLKRIGEGNSLESQ